MSSDPSTWRALRTEGAYTVLEVPVSPGQVMEVPVRTAILGTPDAPRVVQAILDANYTVQDQLREFS